MSLKKSFFDILLSCYSLDFCCKVLSALNSYTRYVYTRVKRIAGRDVKYDVLELD